MIKQEEVFKIGHFSKPHGTKGEIGLVTTSDVFDDSADPYIVLEIDGILVPFFIEEYRDKSSSVILVKLENLNTEEAVRQFTNYDVYYPLDEVSEEDDLIGDITWDSFIGYSVVDTQHNLLGNITEVDESTVNVLLKVQQGEKEILIPAVEEIIIAADHTNQQITVVLPEGLLEL